MNRAKMLEDQLDAELDKDPMKALLEFVHDFFTFHYDSMYVYHKIIKEHDTLDKSQITTHGNEKKKEVKVESNQFDDFRDVIYAKEGYLMELATSAAFLIGLAEKDLVYQYKQQ